MKNYSCIVNMKSRLETMLEAARNKNRSNPVCSEQSFTEHKNICILYQRLVNGVEAELLPAIQATRGSSSADLLKNLVKDSYGKIELIMNDLLAYR